MQFSNKRLSEMTANALPKGFEITGNVRISQLNKTDNVVTFDYMFKGMKGITNWRSSDRDTFFDVEQKLKSMVENMERSANQVTSGKLD